MAVPIVNIEFPAGAAGNLSSREVFCPLKIFKNKTLVFCSSF